MKILARTRENLESQVASISDGGFNSLKHLLNFFGLGREKGRSFFNFAMKWILRSGSTGKRKSFSARFACKIKVRVQLSRDDAETHMENYNSGHRLCGLTDYPDRHLQQLRPIQEIDDSNSLINLSWRKGLSFPHLSSNLEPLNRNAHLSKSRK
jgi:hypothetical protein